jgi:tripartite-type tricarboxylate transporter receptor subunit TctC
VIGAAVVAKSPPDGQTRMVTFDSHILGPAFTANLPYKESELFNVMLVGRAPLVIVCHPDRLCGDFVEVIADARKRPGKVSIGATPPAAALSPACPAAHPSPRRRDR